MADETRFGEQGPQSGALPPDLTPAELMAIAAVDNSRWAEIAVHPAAYPGLLDWLAESGDLEVRAAIARRHPDRVQTQNLAVAPAHPDAGVTTETVRAGQSGSELTAQTIVARPQQPQASHAAVGPTQTNPQEAPPRLAFIAPIASLLAPPPRSGEQRRRSGRPMLLTIGTVIVLCVAAVGVIAGTGFLNAAHHVTTAGPAPSPANAPSHAPTSTPPAVNAALPTSSPSQSELSPSSRNTASTNPTSSTPTTSADRAYCQNRGVLIRVAESETYRGALCSINGTATLIGRSRDVGGSVSLPATSTDTSFSAVAEDGTVYTYTSSAVTIQTRSKMYQQTTTLWQSGTSPQLAAPGDLGLATRISYPACDDTAIIVYGTAWHPATDAAEVQRLLDANPGSSYLRTDLSCSSFAGPSTANSNGAYVYAVYSPAPSASAVCQQIAGTGLYGRWLSNTRAPADNNVAC